MLRHSSRADLRGKAGVGRRPARRRGGRPQGPTPLRFSRDWPAA